MACLIDKGADGHVYKARVLRRNEDYTMRLPSYLMESEAIV